MGGLVYLPCYPRHDSDIIWAHGRVSKPVSKPDFSLGSAAWETRSLWTPKNVT